MNPWSMSVPLVVAIVAMGCTKWVEKESNKARRGDSNRPGGQQSGDTGVPPAKGHIRVTVNTIKSETDAWFKNCLTFLVESAVSQEVRVGCNKDQTGERFLKEETPYDFEVTKGGKVNLKFSFETWFSASGCITYKECANPYPGAPLKRMLTNELQSIRCYKVGPGKFRLFYEDQGDDNLRIDREVRTLLQTKAGETVPAFDPSVANYAASYTLKNGATLNAGDTAHACILAKSKGNSVPEQALQACLGIDYRDFVVDIHAVDTDIQIGDLTDARCQPL